MGSSSVPKMSRRPPVKDKKVITTKDRCCKLPPNVLTVTINGVSFHSEDSVHKWKYVVQRHITNEMNILNKHQFYTRVIELIGPAGLLKMCQILAPFTLD